MVIIIILNIVKTDSTVRRWVKCRYTQVNIQSDQFVPKGEVGYLQAHLRQAKFSPNMQLHLHSGNSKKG